jgi:hypothetical protein
MMRMEIPKRWNVTLVTPNGIRSHVQVQAVDATIAGNLAIAQFSKRSSMRIPLRAIDISEARP